MTHGWVSHESNWSDPQVEKPRPDTATTLVGPGLHRRGGSRRTNAVLILGLAVVAGGVVFGRDLLPPTTPESPTRTTVIGVPGSDAGPIKLWLSATRLPAAGASLAVGMVNQGASSPTFGVGGDVERWNGESWVSHRPAAICLLHWNCEGGLQERGRAGYRAVGLSVRPGSRDVIGRFATQGLDPGWYRLRLRANSGEVATGTFEVRKRAPRPGPLTDVMTTTAMVTPALLSPTGGQVQMWPSLAPTAGVQSMDTFIAATAHLRETATVQRWLGGDWQPVLHLSLTLPPGSPPPASQPARFASLPPLDPGDYRLVRDAAEGAPLIGSFWIRRD